jgi:hypothetical protein
MAQRGRKSAASLSIVSVLGNERPAPPDELTEFQREVWQLTVASEASTLRRAISLSATTPLPATCSAGVLWAPTGTPGGHLEVSANPPETAPAVVLC